MMDPSQQAYLNRRADFDLKANWVLIEDFVLVKDPDLTVV